MKKDLISKHALDVFARDGYHNAKVKDIAKASGIAVGTIYIYFKSKEEILEYIFHTEFEKDSNYLDTLEKEDINPIDKIKKYLEYKYDCVQENPNIIKVIMHNMIPAQSDENGIIVMLFRVLTRLANLIRQGILNGDIKVLDANLFAFFMFRSVQEISYMQLAFELAEDKEKTRGQLVDFYMAGISKQGRPK
jgi:TetR/AcrR family fatty acid metabolism transcriptional regulator